MQDTLRSRVITTINRLPKDLTQMAAMMKTLRRKIHPLTSNFDPTTTPTLTLSAITHTNATALPTTNKPNNRAHLLPALLLKCKPTSSRHPLLPPQHAQTPHDLHLARVPTDITAHAAVGIAQRGEVLAPRVGAW